MLDTLEQILKTTLLISVRNLKFQLQVDDVQLIESLHLLENAGKIRIAYGTGCKSGCSSCGDSCGSKEIAKTINDTTIIVSLIQKHSTAGYE